MKLTVTIVLLLRPINGSICLQLQVETLSTVQLRHDPLQLGLCGSRDREARRLKPLAAGTHNKLSLRGTFHSISVHSLLVTVLEEMRHGDKLVC